VSGEAGVLRLEGLRRSYAGRAVLRGLDLTVRRGEIAVLVGGSGSGKTTLLRIAAGLERAEAGRVRLRGMDVDGASARRFVPPERRALGMVFQEHALWPHLSARENVAVALPPGTARPGAAAEALLEAVELAGLADRRPGTLSGGQQQRVALARALATGSDLLLLDEPLSSLDGAVRDRLRPLIRDMLRRDDRAALFVSHDRLDAWRLADRILVLEHGALSQCAAPQAMYASPASPTAARCMGAEGRLRVQGADGGYVVTAGGCRVPATSVGLTDGMAGVALAHPDGVGIGGDDGLPAIRRDCVFEAGLWRARWQVGCPGDELVGLHRTPPPERATLSVDPAKLFAFSMEGGRSLPGPSFDGDELNALKRQ
jgi:iron(III) transport system ATP-binding protein